jgi:hypothetical protein
MPSGIFPVPEFRSKPSRTVRTRPGPAVRIQTRWRRNRLDDKLALGADPAASPELGLRAAQLGSSAGRSRLADALVGGSGRRSGAQPRGVHDQDQAAE